MPEASPDGMHAILVGMMRAARELWRDVRRDLLLRRIFPARYPGDR